VGAGLSAPEAVYLAALIAANLVAAAQLLGG
jgi:hypothetical protein